MPTKVDAWRMLTHLGPRWVLFRLGYALRRKAGALRRAAPARAWRDLIAESLRLAPPAGAVAIVVGEGAVAEAEAVLCGRFRIFSHREVELGWPPNWHRNALDGGEAPADRHWTTLGDFAFGDIKGIWEINRFGWAFALVRAHRRTANAKYRDAFWFLFGRWCQDNPPGLGPNWMCGQEATFRLMAVIFAAENLGVPDEARDVLARFVLATGERIAANLDYALSQKNNHGISECVGLVTAGLLVPDAPAARGWRARGMRALRRQVAELVYADGAFAQHSLIYHRVLLHDLAWCACRLRAGGEPVPEWLESGARRAHRFLLRLVDSRTGEAPLFGTNDGANVLPLADGDFLDMRPVLQATAAAFGWGRCLPPGPWDEAAHWLGGLPQNESGESAVSLMQEEVWHAGDGGYLLLHGAGGDRLFLRCPERFRHRPAQADMLHADVWLAGEAVTLDGGSFSYNSRERFASLGAAAHHNVLTQEGREPLRKVSRFLYLPWPKGTVNRQADGGWTATHDCYRREGLRWWRTVRRGEQGGWVVEDRVLLDRPMRLRWHWRLAGDGWRLAGEGVEARRGARRVTITWIRATGLRSTLVHGDASSATGWWAPRYGAAEPVDALVVSAERPAGEHVVRWLFITEPPTPGH